MKSLSWVVSLVTILIKEEFTGNVQLNFFKGNISNINKSESFKAPVVDPESNQGVFGA